MTGLRAHVARYLVLLAVVVAVNFFLHGRYLLEQPANRMLTVAATLIDLVVITAVVLAWPGPQGLASPLFVLYYPVLVGFAFVFPPAASAAYTGLALVGYAGTCLLADPSFVDSSRQVELLVQRLTTMAAVGGLATYYWRIQRARRRLARRTAHAGLRRHGLRQDIARDAVSGAWRIGMW